MSKGNKSYVDVTYASRVVNINGNEFLFLDGDSFVLPKGCAYGVHINDFAHFIYTDEKGKKVGWYSMWGHELYSDKSNALGEAIRESKGIPKYVAIETENGDAIIVSQDNEGMMYISVVDSGRGKIRTGWKIGKPETHELMENGTLIYSGEYAGEDALFFISLTKEGDLLDLRGNGDAYNYASMMIHKWMKQERYKVESYDRNFRLLGAYEEGYILQESENTIDVYKWDLPTAVKDVGVEKVVAVSKSDVTMGTIDLNKELKQYLVLLSKAGDVYIAKQQADIKKSDWKKVGRNIKDVVSTVDGSLFMLNEKSEVWELDSPGSRRLFLRAEGIKRLLAPWHMNIFLDDLDNDLEKELKDLKEKYGIRIEKEKAIETNKIAITPIGCLCMKDNGLLQVVTVKGNLFVEMVEGFKGGVGAFVKSDYIQMLSTTNPQVFLNARC